MSYGNVYVASVAMGAKDEHTLRAFLEAEAYPGPSLIIAYSHCIAHGIDMTGRRRQQQKLAVDSGHWPLYRYDPRRAERARTRSSWIPPPPRSKVQDYLMSENRFKMLTKSKPEDAKRYLRRPRATPTANVMDVLIRIIAGRSGAPCNAAPMRASGTGQRQPIAAARAVEIPLTITSTSISVIPWISNHRTYLGLKLRTPLVPAASPLSEEIDGIKQMEDAGASAVVLHSLFEEQLRQDEAELDNSLEHGTESFAEALTYFPEPEEFRLGPEEYLEHIAKAKKAVRMPVIASLNGSSAGGWTDYAKGIQQAGADALELNIYYIPTDMKLTSSQIEQTYLDILKAVKSVVTIPVAVKLSPFFTNFANMAQRFDKAGANGLVLFNRFYQPDIDLEALEVKPNILLSTPMAMRVPLRWIALLYGKLQASLAATSGIHRSTDVLKMLMAGADVTMLCSTLIRHGVRQIGVIERDLIAWMEEHEYESVAQLKGSLSQQNCPDPSAFERAQYMRAISQFPVGSPR